MWWFRTICEETKGDDTSGMKFDRWRRARTSALLALAVVMCCALAMALVKRHLACDDGPGSDPCTGRELALSLALFALAALVLLAGVLLLISSAVVAAGALAAGLIATVAFTYFDVILRPEDAGELPTQDLAT